MRIMFDVTKVKSIIEEERKEIEEGTQQKFEMTPCDLEKNIMSGLSSPESLAVRFFGSILMSVDYDSDSINCQGLISDIWDMFINMDIELDDALSEGIEITFSYSPTSNVTRSLSLHQNFQRIEERASVQEAFRYMEMTGVCGTQDKTIKWIAYYNDQLQQFYRSQSLSSCLNSYNTYRGFSWLLFDSAHFLRKLVDEVSDPIEKIKRKEAVTILLVLSELLDSICREFESSEGVVFARALESDSPNIGATVHSRYLSDLFQNNWCELCASQAEFGKRYCLQHSLPSKRRSRENKFNELLIRYYDEIKRYINIKDESTQDGKRSRSQKDVSLIRQAIWYILIKKWKKTLNVSIGGSMPYSRLRQTVEQQELVGKRGRPPIVDPEQASEMIQRGIKVKEIRKSFRREVTRQAVHQAVKSK